MPFDATSLGGVGRNFPDTSWALVSRLHASGEADYRVGLETLCGRYWKPVCYFVRATSARTHEDAKDQTQAFFAWLLEGGVLKRYSADRGRFRGFLKVILRRFLKDQREAREAQKRGGGRIAFSYDEAEFEKLMSDRKAADPEKEFDRIWAVECARRAVDRVRERLSAEERDLHFRVYETYDLQAGSEKPTYESVGQRLGLSGSQVKNILFAVRGEIKEEVRRELARTLETDADLDAEWRELFES